MTRFSSLAGIASLTLALAAPFATAAYADDEYGTGHSAVIAEAAASRHSAPLSAAEFAKLSDEFKLGRNDAFGAARSSQLAPVPLSTPSRLAALGRTVDGKVDVTGNGGPQDALATQIYTPGSGTDW